MKTSFYALVLLFLYASHMYASDHKITQIIYVEKHNTHDKKSNLLYYVTENHEFHLKNADIIGTDESTEENKCTFYEQSTKDKKYRAIEDRVVLIGQPMYIGKIWTMPAVIKKEGILGRLFRPDICLIKYIKLHPTDDISNEPEGSIKTTDDFESENEDYENEDYENEMQFYFVIERLAERHRTKVTKIGFFKKLDQLLLVSGSEWPTVKSHDIKTMKQITYDDNKYLIDIIPDKYLITSQIEKPWLARNTFTFQTIHTRQTNDTQVSVKAIQQKKLSYLPTIFFDPTKDFTHNFITKTLENYLQESQNKKTWVHSICYINPLYAIIVFPDTKECNVYKKNENSEEIYFANLEEMKVIDKNNDVIITACAFDFSSQTLFYATYDKKQNIQRQDERTYVPVKKAQFYNLKINTDSDEK